METLFWIVGSSLVMSAIAHAGISPMMEKPSA
jgi:hypothetical protein